MRAAPTKRFASLGPDGQLLAVLSAVCATAALVVAGEVTLWRPSQPATSSPPSATPPARPHVPVATSASVRVDGVSYRLVDLQSVAPSSARRPRASPLAALKLEVTNLRSTTAIVTAMAVSLVGADHHVYRPSLTVARALRGSGWNPLLASRLSPNQSKRVKVFFELRPTASLSSLTPRIGGVAVALT